MVLFPFQSRQHNLTFHFIHNHFISFSHIHSVRTTFILYVPHSFCMYHIHSVCTTSILYVPHSFCMYRIHSVCTTSIFSSLAHGMGLQHVIRPSSVVHRLHSQSVLQLSQNLLHVIAFLLNLSSRLPWG